MTKDTRLQRLYVGLTAKERAVLVLRAWKEGRDEDPSWRFSMVETQSREFNHYIGLMNVVNRALGLYLMHWNHEIDKLQGDAGWLGTALLWQIQAYTLGEYIMGATKVPITESDYARRQAEEAEKYRPVAELADLLASRHEGFADDDLEADQTGAPDNDVIVTPKAWERVLAEKTKEIAALAASGTLLGKGRGKALTVQAGSFYGWLGEPVPAYPEWGVAYDVRPDDEAERVGALRTWREDAHKAYREGPTRLVLHREGFSDHPAFKGDGGSQINELVGVIRDKLREDVLTAWRHVRSVEIVVDETGEAFGEDPCVPDVREALDGSKERLVALRKEAEKYVGPFELEEPGEELVEEIRGLTEREVALAT